MPYKSGDMVSIAWPTPLDPGRKVKARLLGEVPETRSVDWKGREFTVGKGWSARVVEPGSSLDQWMIAHVDELCIRPA